MNTLHGPASGRTARCGRVAVILVAILALAGCYKADGRYFSDDIDVQRATRAWNDPWVAPRVTTAAHGGDVLPTVVREVASRTHTASVRPAEAVLDEIHAAQAAGWELTGANCQTRGAAASLKRSGSLDEAAVAWVLAGDAPYLQPPGRIEAEQADPTDEALMGPPPWPVTVKVVVQVPHHLDRTWPDPPAVTVDDTCLAGTLPGVAAQPTQVNKPLPDGAMAEKQRKPVWRAQQPPASLVRAQEAAATDPVLGELGLAVLTELRSDGRDEYTAPSAQIRPRPGEPTTLAETVETATTAGWSLTYTGCWASGMTIAELHRDVTNGYSVALRLELHPDPDAGTIFTAAAVLSTPTEGGPRRGDLPHVTTPCWAVEQPDDVSPAFSWAGIPWFGPTNLGSVQP